MQSGWPRESGSVLIKKLSVVSYKQKKPSNSVYSQRFDHVLFFFLVVFFFLFNLFSSIYVPGLAAQ